jgi:DNA invertase Pin-like site-specific DNA recombinase
MKVAYIRVSSISQNTARQEDAMKQLNVEKVFMEKISGKNAERPELKKMIEFVRSGDCVCVESLSRIGRSTRDVLNIINALQEKDVAFYSMKEAIDTTTPQGKFVLTIFAALAELDRENILQNQKEGLAAAKARKQKLGRPSIETPDNFEMIVQRWKGGEMSSKDAIKATKLKRATFYKMAKALETQVA